MTRGSTTTLGLLLRLVLAAGCLLPFTTPRQLAPVLGFPPVSLTGLPAGQSNEEDDTDQEEAAREAAARPDRRPDCSEPPTVKLPANPRPRAGILPTVARPSPSDPFNNGLGSPYRC